MFHDTPAARTRSRKSAFDPRVTIYEPSNDKVPQQIKQETSQYFHQERTLKRSREEVEFESTSISTTPKRPTRSKPTNPTDPSPTPTSIGRPSQSPSTTRSTKTQRNPSSSPSTPRKPKPIKLELDTPHPAPPRWKETYEIIRRQREGIVAPVDTMGCENGGGRGDDEVISDRDRRFQTLVSLMLSSQTKDPVTAEAMSNLRKKFAGILSLETVLSASDSQIQECINKVGFWRRKTEYIKKTASILQSDFGGDVPKTVDELVSLPGVGPKMAFLCLQSAWGLNVGIGVDTHVHRITARLGWHKETPDPEVTRLNLQSWLPKELHPHINKMLVGFGQVICLPVGPRCDLCQVAQVPGLCPSKRKVVSKKVVKTRVVRMETGEEVVKEEEAEEILVGEESSSEQGPQVKIEVEAEETVGSGAGKEVRRKDWSEGGIVPKVEEGHGELEEDRIGQTISREVWQEPGDAERVTVERKTGEDSTILSW